MDPSRSLSSGGPSARPGGWGDEWVAEPLQSKPGVL
jgi:hypothetical protein